MKFFWELQHMVKSSKVWINCRESKILNSRFFCDSWFVLAAVDNPADNERMKIVSKSYSLKNFVFNSSLAKLILEFTG